MPSIEGLRRELDKLEALRRGAVGDPSPWPPSEDGDGLLVALAAVSSDPLPEERPDSPLLYLLRRVARAEIWADHGEEAG